MRVRAWVSDLGWSGFGFRDSGPKLSFFWFTASVGVAWVEDAQPGIFP